MLAGWQIRDSVPPRLTASLKILRRLRKANASFSPPATSKENVLPADPVVDRAERAFRDAFSEQASRHNPGNVDTTGVVRISRRRTWVRTGLVAAAVLALVAGTVLGVRTIRDDASTASATFRSR